MLTFPLKGWYTRGRFSGIKNGYFLHTNEERITKKKIETTVNSSLSSLLSCRLREGYTINEVNFSQDNSRIVVKLTLPWKISSFIHYVIDSEWPLKSVAKQSPCKIQASIIHSQIQIRWGSEYQKHLNTKLFEVQISNGLTFWDILNDPFTDHKVFYYYFFFYRS